MQHYYYLTINIYTIYHGIVYFAYYSNYIHYFTSFFCLKSSMTLLIIPSY